MIRYVGSDSIYSDEGVVVLRHAGIFRRAVACLVDFILMLMLRLIVTFVVALFTNKLFEGNPWIEIMLMTADFIFGIVLYWVYVALMESSLQRATLGKMLAGIQVTDLRGVRISFARATGRHLAEWFCLFTLGLGYITAIFSHRNQALHDMISGCLVVLKNEEREA